MQKTNARPSVLGLKEPNLMHNVLTRTRLTIRVDVVAGHDDYSAVAS
jgi:hypothetical protein